MAKGIPKDVSLRGPAGKRGPAGEPGAMGERGQRGLPGPTIPREDILAVVADQFEAITKRLDTQLVRMGQMQRELDASRQDTAELRVHLEQVYDLVKALVASTKG